MTKHRFVEIGRSYRVRAVQGGYPLPVGLEEDTIVRVVGQPDSAAIWYDVVDDRGREFHLYGPQIQTERSR